jgi:hypothetical protein
MRGSKARAIRKKVFGKGFPRSDGTRGYYQREDGVILADEQRQEYQNAKKQAKAKK